jgi:hypothetical protein
MFIGCNFPRMFLAPEERNVQFVSLLTEQRGLKRPVLHLAPLGRSKKSFGVRRPVGASWELVSMNIGPIGFCASRLNAFSSLSVVQGVSRGYHQSHRLT